MIKCIAIDDEPLALQQIASYIEKVDFLHLEAQMQSAIKAVEFLQENTVDAIFCDINMPDLSGMQFVRSLASPPLIVFTTAYSEYAVEGFEVNAVDYLLKPFGMQEFLRAANRLRERLEPQVAAQSATPAPCALFLKTEYRVVRVDVADIKYVQAMSEYLKVYVDGSAKPIITHMSMKLLLEQLPANFKRIHRSYIVNVDRIESLQKQRVAIDADTLLPIGDNYREEFLRSINVL